MSPAKRQAPEYCASCKQITAEPVLIRTHEGISRFGSTYACPDCIAAGRVTVDPELVDLATERRADQ